MSAGARVLVEFMPDQSAPQTVRFGDAFTAHHRAVYATARAVVRDAALAEEVRQGVFLKLYRHLGCTPSAELLRAWLLRVTVNEARNTIRGHSRSRARDTEYQRT